MDPDPQLEKMPDPVLLKSMQIRNRGENHKEAKSIG
jgi:hypothetical protein